MEEDWRGEAERIDAVEDAAVAFDHHAKILDADVALDGAHHQSAGETKNADGEGHAGGLQRRERRRPTTRPFPRPWHWRLRR